MYYLAIQQLNQGIITNVLTSSVSTSTSQWLGKP